MMALAMPERQLLALKEQYRLSQAAVDFTVGAVNLVITIVSVNTIHCYNQYLATSISSTQDIDHLFNPENVFEN